MQDKKSDLLLSQILILLQDQELNRQEADKRLSRTEEAIASIDKRIDNIIIQAFPENDLIAHRRWHDTRNLSPIKKWVYNWLEK